MSKLSTVLGAFNRGIVSKNALARVDVDRIRLSCETMDNFTPKAQGEMFLRAGLEHIGSSYSDAAATWIDFVAATTDTALLEITDSKLRVWIDDTLLTRPSVATSISNGSFATNANWTDASTSGGTLTFGGSGLILNAVNRGGIAKCTRTITVAAPAQNVEHGLKIVVGRGPVVFRVGSSAGGDEYVSETSLGTGAHSLAFTPTGDFYLQFLSELDINRIVTSIAVEAAGTVELTAPWPAASLADLRWEQSADVVFVACKNYQQYRIERRGTGRSWSVIKYVADDGPFFESFDNGVKLKVAATHGNTTLTADRAFFKSTHVGAIFRLFNGGYTRVSLLGAEDTYTDTIRVTGVYNGGGTYNDRNFSTTIAGTWVGTLSLLRSFDGPDSGFMPYGAGFTTNHGATNTSDNDNNTIAYYKVGFKSGDYTSGTATVTISYDGGGDYGICRVTGYTSSTVVDVEILRPISQTTYTSDWREGYWSDYRGWPTAVCLHEGRLIWAGKTRFFGSVSDSFASYSEEVTGDSGPIVRSIGSGPIDVVNFMLPLAHLLLGTASAEISVVSSSLDEPLTPTNSGAKPVSSYGSATVRALKIDLRGVFVNRSNRKLFELTYDGYRFRYASKELTILSPDIMAAGVVQMAVQRQLDTRLHFVMTDGTAVVFTYEPEQEITCFSTISTDGIIENVVVLPGEEEDRVYYHVKRVINGVTKRFLEKFSLESECVGGNTSLGGSLNKQADCFTEYSQASSTTVTGLSLYEGEQVVVWNGNIPVTVDGVTTYGDAERDTDGSAKLFTVSGGQITGLSLATTVGVVGLPYDGTWKSSKLAYGAQAGTALGQPKRIDNLGFILANTHHRGIKFGRDANNLDPLSGTYKGAPVVEGRIFEDYDVPTVAAPGSWDADSRLYLKASSPRPCRVLAAIITMATNEKL